jgi:hypothetical protein
MNGIIKPFHLSIILFSKEHFLSIPILIIAYFRVGGQAFEEEQMFKKTGELVNKTGELIKKAPQLVKKTLEFIENPFIS